MFVRFLIVDELNRSVDRGIDILNRTSLIVGFFAMMGMVVVAAYPVKYNFYLYILNYLYLKVGNWKFNQIPLVHALYYIFSAINVEVASFVVADFFSVRGYIYNPVTAIITIIICTYF